MLFRWILDLKCESMHADIAHNPLCNVRWQFCGSEHVSEHVMQLVQNNWIWNTIFTDFLHQDIYLFFTCSQFFNIESADSGFHLVTLLTGKVT